MKKYLLMLFLGLSLHSCMTVSDAYAYPSSQYEYYTESVYYHTYYYNGYTCPVIYFSSTPYYYYNGNWHVIPNNHHMHIRRYPHGRVLKHHPPHHSHTPYRPPHRPPHKPIYTHPQHNKPQHNKPQHNPNVRPTPRPGNSGNVQHRPSPTRTPSSVSRPTQSHNRPSSSYTRQSSSSRGTSTHGGHRR